LYPATQRWKELFESTGHLSLLHLDRFFDPTAIAEWS
jgi:hypothetical protein